MCIALGILDVEETLAASSARLVDYNDRLLGQIVLCNYSLYCSSHLIGSTASSGRNDDFYRVGRFPRISWNNRKCKYAAGKSSNA